MVDIAGFNKTRIVDDGGTRTIYRLHDNCRPLHASRITKWPLGQVGMSRASFGWLMEGCNSISHSEHEDGNVLLVELVAGIGWGNDHVHVCPFKCGRGVQD